jgi:hypothetical protein
MCGLQEDKEIEILNHEVLFLIAHTYISTNIIGYAFIIITVYVETFVA